MSIYVRQKTWWYSITVNGKTHRGSCQTEDEKQAREFHDRLRADIWRGRVLRDDQKRTVSEAISRFLQERANKRSCRDDHRHGEWWQAQFSSLGVRLLEEVTPDLVAGIRNKELRRTTRLGKAVSPSTVNRKLAFLRSVINAAAKEWLWLESAPKFRLIPGETQRRRYLTAEEVKRLAAVLPQPYADMARFAVATGMRQSNVLGLKWAQLDLERRKATFPHEVMKNGRPFSCPLNETAMTVINRWIGKHHEFVFTGPGGRVNSVPSRMWARALKQAGLVDVRWHDLRHTWASLMRQSGVTLSDLKELGGWESHQMVDRYAHLNIEHLAPKAAAIDGALREEVTA
jgi:integrase